MLKFIKNPIFFKYPDFYNILCDCVEDTSILECFHYWLLATHGDIEQTLCVIVCFQHFRIEKQMKEISNMQQKTDNLNNKNKELQIKSMQAPSIENDFMVMDNI